MLSSFYTRSDASACREVPAASWPRAGTGAPRLHQMGTGGRCVPPIQPKESPIMNKPLFALVLGLALAAGPAMHAEAAAPAPHDAPIAHIAYTAGAIDVTPATQALPKAHNPAVLAFAAARPRGPPAVDEKALDRE